MLKQRTALLSCRPAFERLSALLPEEAEAEGSGLPKQYNVTPVLRLFMDREKRSEINSLMEETVYEQIHASQEVSVASRGRR